MNARARLSVAGTLAIALGAATVAFAPLLAQAPAAKTARRRRPPRRKPWAVPRTPDGKPDLQGNWSNETQTPLERMGKQGATLTKDEAAAIEDRAKLVRRVPRQGERSESSGAGQGRRRAQPERAGRASFIERISRGGRRQGRRLQRLLARSRRQGDHDRRRRPQLDHRRSAGRPRARPHRRRQAARWPSVPPSPGNSASSITPS